MPAALFDAVSPEEKLEILGQVKQEVLEEQDDALNALAKKSRKPPPAHEEDEDVQVNSLASSSSAGIGSRAGTPSPSPHHLGS